MKKSFASTVAAALALSCTAAFGADMKCPARQSPHRRLRRRARGTSRSVASGATDYIWRGITQSNHKPSVSAYTELRYNVDARRCSGTAAWPATASASRTGRG